MKVRITPGPVSGHVMLPSSKSMAHRALICASLASGTSRISGIHPSKDIEATIACMQALGARITRENDLYIVEGTDGSKVREPIVCDCHESGSTLRFLIPVASLTNKPVTFIGQGRLMERPMGIYETLFNEQGLTFEQKETIRIHGALSAGDYVLPGDVSSQFISGLLFTLPLVDGNSTLTVTEPFESKSYVDLTLQMLQKFGIRILRETDNRFIIPGNQKFQPRDLHVEGDYSQLAFFGVLAALQNSLQLHNMDPDSLQGDRIILDFLKQTGAEVSVTTNTVTVSHHQLLSSTMDLADCPDLGPVCCVLAAFCPGTTRLLHTRRLRIKESDRVAAMEEELKKWGVDITSDEDSITIKGKPSTNKEQVIIDGHNDHRIVMAMTVFGLCADAPCIIEGAQAITKSYPTFFEDIQAIGGKVEIV